MSKYLKITTDKSPLSYKSGEEMKFTVNAFDENGNKLNQKIAYRISGDDGKIFEGITDISENDGALITSSCDRPGFVRLMIRALNDDLSCDNEYILYNAGAGADTQKIEYHGTIPDDYNDYWNNIKKEVNSFDLKILETEPYYNDISDDYLCFDIKLSTPLSSGKVSGFLTYPKKEGKYPVRVTYQGYSVAGCVAPECEKNTIVLLINAHGIENGFSNEVIQNKYKHLANYGFEDDKNLLPQTSYWQGVMVRDLVAVRYAKTLPMWNKKDLIISGGSQGAFQSAIVAANDDDVTSLALYIPWFCDLNAEKFGYQAGWRPKPANGLEYFDTVAAIMNVKCPVLIHAGLGDYVCPPCTTMALYNCAKSPKSITYTQCMEHGAAPDDYDSFVLKEE